jgi:outer membrane protein
LDNALTGATGDAAATVGLCNTFNELYTATGEPVPPAFSNCQNDFGFSSADSASLTRTVTAGNSTFPFAFSNEPVTLTAFFSLPLFNGFDRQVQVEQALAVRNDWDYQVRGLELQLRADVTEAVRNLETAYRTVLLQRENTARAREEMRLAQERYQLGAGTFLELLDSQTLSTQAEVDEINATYGFHQSLAALEAAVGRPLQLAPGE